MTATKRNYRRWLAIAFGLALLPLLWAPAANAVSLIKVREVYPGTNNDSYIELQAFGGFLFAGDTLPGKSVILFDDDGAPTLRFTFVESNNLGADNTSFLVGDSGVQEAFGVTPDVTDPLMNLDPDGGAACWNIGDVPVDCAAWGDFSGQAALQAYAGSSVGTPASAGGITAGKAIERSIAPNCPTWLEADDDTDDSATDFFEVNPNPQRTGDYDPTQSPCTVGIPQHSAFLAKPANPSNDPSPHFAYTADEATSYQCKLDSAPRFTACPNAGQDYSNLADGSHALLVRGLNPNGPDATPASYTWIVDTAPPTATIISHPATTSFGKKASFAFSSGESSSTYLCSLDAGSSSSCRSGITLGSLTAGPHTFHVVAVDPAGNVQPSPTSYAWTVDITPPATTIDSGPSDPTAASSASFTYHASRPDAVFECSMDGAGFSSCPTTGATYTGLAKGGHTFSVRAVDSDNVVEASPPSYSFTIASTKTQRITCKKGFKKKTVRGKVRCVKKKKPRPRKHKRH